MPPRLRQATLSTQAPAHPLQRIRWWYAALIVVGGVFLLRAFYLQVIRHDYYQSAAFRSQLKQYEIPAQRGVISAYDGDAVVPLVLNETLYTLFADPQYVKDAPKAAIAIQRAIGGEAGKYEKLLKTPDTRYVVLAKRLSSDQRKKVDALNLKGIGTRDYQYRTYPDGQLASQLLGFVNDDGEGKYGIEEALNKQLKGEPGELKAITDAHGVPLPANRDNRIKDPVAGKQMVLTIDVGIQQQTEDVLKAAVERTKAKSASVVILDANSGAVRAMANYPTYNPAEYNKVEDGALFNNNAVSYPIEVGSTMKALTAAAALDQGVVNKNSTYYDPASYKIDDATVRNVEEDGGPGTKSISDILQLSLNTGATWLLMQMGGGTINSKARNAWHDYMVNHYQLSKPTGIEQGFEDPGYVPEPDKGYGLNITYANTAFGQGMTATPLQMGAAFAATVNGGTYYRPHLVDKEINDAAKQATVHKPQVVRGNAIGADVSAQVREMLEYTFRKNQRVYTNISFTTAYSVGGKTGTAQISKPSGGYYDDRYNGTYLGFVGGDKPEYVISVRVSEPQIVGYAGAKAAAPVFAELAHILINNYGVTPKSQ
jgi:cell division protein FtsI/penicillin-binding protein 2